MNQLQGFTAELQAQDDPEIGRELIHVRFDDGSVEALYLHDYERLYSLPGVYETIVQERLRCRSPTTIACMLASAVDDLGWDRGEVRVLDVAAGNGVSGEALAAEGLRPVVGTDIVPAARAAALRDRPGLYDSYLVADLLALSAPQRAALAGAGANALCCVAPVGAHSQQLPAAALAAAARFLAPDALVAYMYEPRRGAPDVVTPAFWGTQVGGGGATARELGRRRYVHRQTVNGQPFEMEGVVQRVRRR